MYYTKFIDVDGFAMKLKQTHNSLIIMPLLMSLQRNVQTHDNTTLIKCALIDAEMLKHYILFHRFSYTKH